MSKADRFPELRTQEEIDGAPWWRRPLTVFLLPFYLLLCGALIAIEEFGDDD